MKSIKVQVFIDKDSAASKAANDYIQDMINKGYTIDSINTQSFCNNHAYPVVSITVIVSMEE